MPERFILIRKAIGFTLAVIILSFMAGYAISRAWTEPTASPPSGNVAAPINVGAGQQAKVGEIGAGRFYDTSWTDYDLDIGGDSHLKGSLEVGVDNSEAHYFKLPNLSTAQRDSLDLTGQGYGQLIYNYTNATLEGYGPGGWTVLAQFATLGAGQGCTYDSDCTSGHCADGVCCNSACTGNCEACNLAGTEGTCTIRAENDDTELTTLCDHCNGIDGTSVNSGDNGVDCTEDCTHCVSGSCAVRSEDDNTEVATTCYYCNGVSATSVASSKDQGVGCTEDCTNCVSGSCDIRTADDNTEFTTPCYHCDGTASTSVPEADADNGYQCTDDCTHCISGSCTNWPDNEQHEGCTGVCQACQSGACGAADSGTDPGNRLTDLSCSITSGSCADTTLFKMYATTNSHAELPNQANYSNYVCCSGGSGLGTSCAGNYRKILNLSGATNAHVEKSTQTNYANGICISITDGTINCAYATDCSALGSEYTCVASISGDTNAHVGGCDAYSTKVCCANVCQ
jgi:hypothetical protein